MIVRYGTYTFPDGEVRVTLERSSEFGDSGARERERLGITLEGDRVCASAEAFETFAAALYAAFLLDGQDLVVTYTDATACDQLTFLAADMLQGPRVVEGPSFPKGDGAELAPGASRSYRIRLEAVRKLASPSRGDLVSFKETITYGGGRPIYQISESLAGDPEIWMTAAKTAYKATQSGEAVGRDAYPEPAPELWPGARIDNNPVEKASPEMVYLDDDGVITTALNYRISWNYEYASASDEFAGGTPHRWNDQV